MSSADLPTWKEIGQRYAATPAPKSSRARPGSIEDRIPSLHALHLQALAFLLPQMDKGQRAALCRTSTAARADLSLLSASWAGKACVVPESRGSLGLKGVKDLGLLMPRRPRTCCRPYFQLSDYLATAMCETPAEPFSLFHKSQVLRLQIHYLIHRLSSGSDCLSSFCCHVHVVIGYPPESPPANLPQCQLPCWSSPAPSGRPR